MAAIRRGLNDHSQIPRHEPQRRANLSELIDQPQNPALRLQIMAASYSAILRWEPRVKLTGITFETTIDGKMVVDITGTRTGSAAPLSLTIPVS
ncbi:baseplate assembly protein [Yersinia enterocolitica]|uniref:baseplate assembly protein n=1 Tax=Yersinia enterocolitica TaxID=630 RepID=UPI003BF9D815